MKATKHEAATVAYAHVASLLFGVPLAMTADRAKQLASHLSARMYGEPGAAVDVTDLLTGTPLAVEMLPDGIARVDIRGTLTPKGSNMDALSGLVSYDKLTATLQALAADTGVRGVLVAINSPGGAIAGVSQAADAMAALAAAKPGRVYAVADHNIASAAYRIAAPAAKIFASPDGLMGSIGTIMVREDATGADAQAGRKFTFISNMDRKSDGSAHKPLEDDELAATQAIIDHADAAFLGAIAEARGLSVAALRKLNGAVLLGGAAVTAKLADAVGSVDDALMALRAELARTDSGQRRTGVAAHAQGGTQMDEKVTPATPAVVAAADPAKVVPIDKDNPEIKAAIDAAAAKAVQDAHEVVALCASFRCPERANAFLAAKQTRDQVFAVLQAELVAKDQATATSGTHAGGAPEAETKKLDPAAYEALRNTAVLEALARRTASLTV